MRRLMTVLAAAIVLPLTACGDDSTPTEEAAAVSGTYSLRTINGEDLPVTIDQQGDDITEVIHGSVTFHAASLFTDSVTFRFTIGGEVTIDEDAITGTYEQTGSTVVLTPSDESDSYAMSVSGNTLTQTFVTHTFEPFTLVYRK
jgi:uncharacterized lipoprotein YehR (DUF1307 family)